MAIFDFLTILDSNQPISLDTVNIVKNEVDIRNQHDKLNLPANFEPIRLRSTFFVETHTSFGKNLVISATSIESAQNLQGGVTFYADSEYRLYF